jgi:hypothetical protein
VYTVSAEATEWVLIFFLQGTVWFFATLFYFLDLAWVEIVVAITTWFVRGWSNSREIQELKEEIRESQERRDKKEKEDAIINELLKLGEIFVRYHRKIQEGSFGFFERIADGSFATMTHLMEKHKLWVEVYDESPPPEEEIWFRRYAATWNAVNFIKLLGLDEAIEQKKKEIEQRKERYGW